MEECPQVKILVCCHKPCPTLKSDVFVPIQVGKSLTSGKLDMISDDTGSNISYKNPNYAELTALYWAWKNYESLNSPDYIGLYHYRRFLNFGARKSGMYPWQWAFLDFSPETIQSNGWDDENIRKCCQDTDLIIPDPVQLLDPENSNQITYLEDQYKKAHVEDNFDLAMSLIKRLYPDYRDVIEDVRRSFDIYLCNMFIMKKEHFFEYMSWLFSILFEIEKLIDTTDSEYGGYQQRVYGFLGERLFNFFIEKKRREPGFSTKECQVLTGYLSEAEKQEYYYKSQLLSQLGK